MKERGGRKGGRKGEERERDLRAVSQTCKTSSWGLSQGSEFKADLDYIMRPYLKNKQKLIQTTSDIGQLYWTEEAGPKRGD